MTFSRALIEQYLPSIQNETVVHYTRLGTLVHLLGRDNGWNSAYATPVQFLNDRQEQALGLRVLSDLTESGGDEYRPEIHSALTVLNSSHGELASDAFQMSFSGNPDDLGQWRGYGDNGNGCAIITSVEDVYQAAQIAGWVIYAPEQQKEFAGRILEELHNLASLSGDDMQQILIASASFMKHPKFSIEQEYRLVRFADPAAVIFRETCGRLVPTIDYLDSYNQKLSVKEIMIGPGWQLAGLEVSQKSRHHVIQGIRRLLNYSGLEQTDITVSSIPYDPR